MYPRVVRYVVPNHRQGVATRGLPHHLPGGWHGQLHGDARLHKFQKKHKVKLGFMSVFVKVATAALQEVTVINTYINDEAKEIVYCNVSVAAASPNGLVVHVLRNTEYMIFLDVKRTIALYGQKAQSGTLDLGGMSGGTFTWARRGMPWCGSAAIAKRTFCL